ncbi:MAG: hypothetical protein ACRDPR_09370 [Nocardioidaceae bacterium]
MIDAGRIPAGLFDRVEGDWAAIDAAGPVAHYAVLRGPCYVGLATLAGGCGGWFDGAILLLEDGRALTERDVLRVNVQRIGDNQRGHFASLPSESVTFCVGVVVSAPGGRARAAKREAVEAAEEETGVGGSGDGCVDRDGGDHRHAEHVGERRGRRAQRSSTITEVHLVHRR